MTLALSRHATLPVIPMSTATTNDVTIRFATTSTAGQFKLLELPPELVKIVEEKDATALA